MSMLRCVTFGFVSAMAIVSPAAASDLWGDAGLKDGYAAVNNWSGFYFGANAGYGWNNNNLLTVEAANLNGVANLATEGAFGGLQAGYNWQRNRFVFGLELDIQGADYNDTKSAMVPSSANLSGSAQAKSSLDWFGTVRGRAGAAVLSQGLIYATGGFAYGQVDDVLSLTGFNAPAQQTAGTASRTVATGYTVGGGFEYAFNRAWSMKLEYQYMDLGSVSLSEKFSVGGQAFSAALSADRTYQTVRGAVNYHVSSPYEPLK